MKQACELTQLLEVALTNASLLLNWSENSPNIVMLNKLTNKEASKRQQKQKMQILFYAKI